MKGKALSDWTRCAEHHEETCRVALTEARLKHSSPIASRDEPVTERGMTDKRLLGELVKMLRTTEKCTVRRTCVLCVPQHSSVNVFHAFNCAW